MDIFGIIGLIGGLLFFLKVLIHVYIVYVTTGKFPLGLGAFTPFYYFAPIVRNVEKKYQSLKLIANVMYWVSITLMVIFLIDWNTGKKHD